MLKPAPCRCAVHCGDDRLFEPVKRLEDVLQDPAVARSPLKRRGVVLARLQIGTGAKAAPGTGQYHASDIGVVADDAEKGLQLVIHLVGRRVHRIGAIERDRRDPVGYVVDKRLIGHNRSAFQAASRAGGTCA